MARNFGLRPLLLGFVVLLLDCASLDKLTPGTCGNGVVEGTEDCDSFPDNPNDTSNARCGAPSEGELACHLRCGAQSNGTTLTCPDGWGCNVHGICREPTGEFTTALGAVSGGVNQLAVGDFDGDGRRDLIGFGLRSTTTNASRLRVHFFDDVGALTTVAVLPGQGVSPVVFEHDKRQAIAAGYVFPGSAGALGVVSGLPDKTFLPVVFPSLSIADTEAVPGFVFAHRDVALPTGNLFAILIIARDTPTSASLKSLDAEVGGTVRLDRPLPLGPEAVVGKILSAPLFPGNTTSGCGELVAAMQPDGDAPGSLFVISPCLFRVGAKTAKWDSESATGFKTFALDVALRSEANGGRGAMIADVDDDGRLDVLIDTKVGPYVAYGDPTGATLLAPRPWAPAGITPMMPLAAGDVDLDGKTDFVLESSVVVKKPFGTTTMVSDAGADADASTEGGVDAGTPNNRDGVLYPTPRPPIDAWTAAAVGSFNADAYPDVVTAHLGSPDLQVFFGDPNGVTMTTVTTDGRVEAIEKGDFDGDHVDDVAITESTSVAGTSNLSIAYGRAVGGLEAPTRIGSIDKPRGLGVAAHGSSPADLGFYSYAKSLNAGKTFRTTSFTLLNGSGDRQPVAPLLFVETLSCTRMTDPCMPMARPQLPLTTARFWQPIGLAAGRFKANADSAVLAYATGTTGTGASKQTALGAWVADADVNALGGLDAPVERQILDGTLDVLDSNGSARLATATGNIDSSDKLGLEKIVAITNAPNAPGALLLVVDPAIKGGPPVSTFLAGLQVVPGAELALVDLDGDGLLDAVGSFGAAPDTQVYVFLNQGKGTFAAQGIKLAFSGDPSTADVGAPIAFAPINLRGAPPTGGSAQTKGLAVLTQHSVVVVTLKPDKQSFSSQNLSSRLGNGVGNATGIAAGDFNGDGVDDIAIADGSIRILLQTPARSK